ncbi:Immediate early response 3-interacting protein 1 [Bagarius yarrelli]|uniref:Immediate early response 3-interacting protein 1 n=1 Tax=Bagarius yarrelli TaxID=175774 RepID=A0A556U2X2_BAGYA|nr:Immediate early response 3-interacting protein 1 [Bagarius yarrelli]
MAFTLYSLIQAAILFTNAIAVLHEERFLRKIGWGADQGIGGFGDEPGIKAQLLNLIRSVRTVMRGKSSNITCQNYSFLFSCYLSFNLSLFPSTVPLIIVNAVCIVLLLLFG